MNPHSDSTAETVAAYLAGELSPDAAAAFDHDLANQTELRHVVHTMGHAWKQVPPRHNPLIKAAVLANVTASIEAQWAQGMSPRGTPASRETDKASDRIQSVMSSWLSRRASWIVPAAFAMMCVVAATMFLRQPREDSSLAAAVSMTDQGTQYRIYSTAPGQRAEVELGDGTRVILNVASRLEVARGFGVSHRSVRLTGEARFTVAHVNNLPFAVSASGTRTTVLGTDFGVRAYDAQVQVVVKSGRISVTPCDVPGVDHCDRANGTVLDADASLIVTPDGRMHADSSINVDRALAFSRGHYVLTGLPLKAVIDDLNRWYDVTIQLLDPTLGDQPLKGELSPGNVEDLARMLELTLQARTTYNGKTLQVYR